MAETTLDVGNRYRVLDKLGEGGMGAVYLVEDTTVGRQVALKALTARQGMDEAAFLGFKQEFRTMAKLRHPNTCEVYDYGRLPDGTPYFTMEVVPGQGLDELIERARPQPEPDEAGLVKPGGIAPEELPAILQQLALALGYVHQRGYVHCDVKPDNVRVRPDGVLKLMDFGLMELAGPPLDAIKGTLAYLAPEVAKLDRLDARADIYSLGAVMYHLLVGEPPFKAAEAEGPVAILRAHLNQAPVAPRELVPGIPAVLERVVLRMLAKEPSARYNSTYDVLAALGLAVDEGMGATLLASPFIGRQVELARLLRALAELKSGRGQTLWIAGAAGMGKSRLLSELRCAVQLDEVAYVTGTCDDRRAPYGAFIEVLRGLLPAVRSHCAQALVEHGPLLAKLLPELADGRPAPQMEPKEEKILLQAAFTELILGATTGTGCVIALENWDLADALSIETLAYLQRNATDAALLIVGASRSRERAAGTLVELGPLDVQETGQMVAGMLGVEGLPTPLLAQLYDLTGGNPQFVAHLLEHLLGSGALVKSKGAWQLPDAIDPSNLPGDVKELLTERLAGLPETALRVVELAAVIGRPFPVSLSSQLLGLDDESLFDALDAAVQARVLTPQENHHFMFADAALRHAVYDRIPAAARTQWHTDLALYLENRLPENTVAPLEELTALARHFLAASADGSAPLAERAIQYALEAGGRNVDIFALETARKLLEPGLALLSGSAKTGESWDKTRCDYLNLLATLYHWEFDLDRANQCLQEGIPLAEKLGDKPRLLEMLVTKAKNGSLAGTSARVKESLELFERAVGLAEELDNARTSVRARVNLGRCLFFNGQQHRAREVFAAAAARAKEANLTSWYASSLSFWGYLEVAGGAATREQGFARLAEATAIQERIGDKGGLEYSLNLLFEIQLQAGRLREAELSAQRNTALANELGIQDDYVIGLLNQSIVALERGDLDRALEMGTRCESVARELAHRVALPISRAVLALTCLQRGQFARGIELLRAAETLARETSTYVYSIVIPFVVEGWLLVGQLQEALNAAQEALFMLRSMDDPNAQVRLWTYLAEIQGRMGQTEVARDFADRAVTAALDSDAKGSLTRGLRARATLARKEHPDDARRQAEQALGLAGVIGADLLAIQCHLIIGDLALDGGYPEAASHFQAAQALADRAGAQLHLALAQFGHSQALPSSDLSTNMLIQAQKALRGMAQELDGDQQKGFLAQPEISRVLDKIPGVQADPLASPEASQQTLERLQRVSMDLQNVASQYGVLFKEWTAKSNQLEMLNNLARQINETLQIDAVLVQVVRLTLDITKAERCFLLLRDEEDPNNLVCQAAFNQFGRAIPHERSSMSVCHKVLATGQSLAIMDATADTEFQSAKSITALNLRTLMCVPLQAKGKALGVLYVDSQAVVTTFTEKDLELLGAIASHASVAIENATLYTALNRRAAELERAIELYRKADYEASTDMLTGLRNRRFFYEQAARELDISRRYTRHMSVIMIDVDHFKRFNDAHGHAVGDEVLKAVSDIITKAVRSCDLAARLGGEEFVVLCPDTDGQGAMILADRMRQSVLELAIVDFDGEPVRQVSVSLGIAEIRAADKELGIMLDRADVALYAAKAGGRNQVQTWREGLVGDGATQAQA